MSCPDCGSAEGRDPQTERCRDCGRLPASSDQVEDAPRRLGQRPTSPSRAYRHDTPQAPLAEPLAATVRGLALTGPLEPAAPYDDGHPPPLSHLFGSPTRKVRCVCSALIVVLERDPLPERCGFCRRRLDA